jgi:hypothetical protein
MRNVNISMSVSMHSFSAKSLGSLQRFSLGMHIPRIWAVAAFIDRRLKRFIAAVTPSVEGFLTPSSRLGNALSAVALSSLSMVINVMVAVSLKASPLKFIVSL